MVQVLNCHDSAIYILAPLRYATIYGCSDATIVLGAVGKVGLRSYNCNLFSKEYCGRFLVSVGCFGIQLPPC